MTRLSRPIAVSVHGAPAPKGDLVCIGRQGNIAHKLVPKSGPRLRKWLRIIDPAADKLRQLAGGVIDAPLGVELVFTLERPAAATVWERPWPAVRNGDVDKLARAVLDGLTVTRKRPERGVLVDDAIVCELVARKVYPDTPDAADRLTRLTRAGIVIRLYPIDEPPALLPLGGS